MIPSISFGEHAASGARLAGKDALARLFLGVEGNAAYSSFQLLELVIHDRRVDEVAVGEPAVDFRIVGVLRREESFKFGQTVDADAGVFTSGRGAVEER